MSTLNSDKSRKKYKIILNKNISRKKQIATTKSNCAISQNRRKKNDRLRFQILIIQKIRSTIVAEMGPLLKECYRLVISIWTSIDTRTDAQKN